MLLNIAQTKRRRRSRREGPTHAPPASLRIVGVENVVYDEPILSFTVVFNVTAENPLVVGTLDPAKWSGVYQGGGFAGYDASQSGFDRIEIQLTGTIGAGGPGSVSYSNDPSDVADALGRQLAAFEGFPF